MDVIKFAKVILAAQEIREKSWTGSAYRLRLDRCVDLALQQQGLGKEWVQPIYFLLLLAWNDVAIWAKTFA